jgi:hypothetical protein
MRMEEKVFVCFYIGVPQEPHPYRDLLCKINDPNYWREQAEIRSLSAKIFESIPRFIRRMNQPWQEHIA